MPYVALEDVGTTRRRSLSGRRRLQAWERTGGTCVLCDRRIDGVRERWIVEHIRALELGGMDDIDNMGPAHEACGREKTRDDHARAAEAKRQKIRHLGAAVVARPLPGSRAGPLKRKVNGTVVRRDPAARLSSNAKLESAPEEALNFSPTPRSVDPTAGSVDRLCVRPAPSAKVHGAGTKSQMTNQPRLRRREIIPNPDVDAAESGEVRPDIPAHLAFLFDERPLLPGEVTDQYDALLRSIVQQVKPVDVIEAIWVKDVVDLIWEAKRLRRWRRQILAQARLKAAEELISPALQNADPMGIDKIIGAPSADSLAAGWVTNSEPKRNEVDALLQKRGLTAEDVTAHAFMLSLPVIERIDRLVSMADQRRDALLREIERKRASFAQQVRTATADSLDVEDADIP
ncbi:HNH endonuclease signature motif containing protein [Methylobacterium sp. E-066]|uniref:HNH endonuclease signature motif containing protein n=1 Tax=Methylobacterium sp. E-066 TaxID=2836584 RepID=UPI00244465E6|nr:HNH endonuclease signature motif containing protein [Methylobacterium sp. E-066]